MPRSKIIIALGFLIALLPLLGFPLAWERFFQVFAGLSIAGLSVWISIDKKLTLKAKAQRRAAQRRAQELATLELKSGSVDLTQKNFREANPAPNQSTDAMGI